MADVRISEEALRQMLKEAVADALIERRDLLHDIVAEVLEDFGLAEAIREGRNSDTVSRDRVFAALKGEV